MQRKSELLEPDLVADFIISYSNDRDIEITNLKLQKLIYYAQAWFLAIYEKPLFEAEFEAWIHGPVLPQLYQRFRNYSWNPITIDKPVPTLPNEVKSHLEEVIGIYGKYEAWQLERLVHNEDPWRLARKNIPDGEPSKNTITQSSMKTFYRSLME